MAFTIPWTEPECVTVGDRLQWKRNLLDYPATTEGWTLTYYLRANFPGGQIDITSAADGDYHSVDVAPSTTVGWTSGIYYWKAYVAKSGDRKLIREASITLLPNFADVTQAQDFRSHARRTLDSINAVIENRATRDEQAYVMQTVGRSLTRIPIADLLKFRDYYVVMVKQEERAELIEQGKNTGKNVLIRFNL